MLKNLLLFPALLLMFCSCENWNETYYSENKLEYDLTTISAEYNYTGKAVFKEIASSGRLELTITLDGPREDRDYGFPAHLHVGPYGEPDAAIEQMLSPVDIRTLKSVTILDDNFDLKSIEDGDRHIKVHLASEGPDYHVVLVAGNVGRNDSGE